jgi:hypothetical protein
VDDHPGQADGRDPWVALLDEIGEACRESGLWGSEARRIRDAAGIARIGRRAATAIEARLFAAGYELDEPLKHESQPVVVTPRGTRELAALLEPLLPDLRACDAVVGNAPWRDQLVSLRGAGRHLARQHGAP